MTAEAKTVALCNSHSFDPEAWARITKRIDEMRILLDDEHAKCGKLNNGTVAAIMGPFRRAVHMNIDRTSTNESGARVDMGDKKGPTLSLEVSGPIAPRMDLTDPRTGMERVLDAIAPASLNGVKEQASAAQQRIWHICAILAVDEIATSMGSDAWQDWDSLEITFPSTLSPLKIISKRLNVGGHTFFETDKTLSAEFPGRIACGAIAVRCLLPLQGEVRAFITPHSHLYRYEELPRVDAMSKLRLLNELRDLDHE